MSNLTERLRDEPSWYHIRRNGLPLPECEVWHRVCCEAADEIERLTAATKALAEGNIKLQARISEVEGDLDSAEEYICELRAEQEWET